MKLLLGIILSIAAFGALANSQCISYTGTLNKEPCTPLEIPVLMYHDVTDKKSPAENSITVSKFKEQIEFLVKNGYTTVTPRQLTEFMNGNIQLPHKTVVISIDDGWKSSMIAADILDDHNLSAVFYIISGSFDDQNYLSRLDVFELSKNPNFEIGAHTHTHFMDWIGDLTKLDTRIMVGEITMSKAIIEQVIGKKVTSFAWPFGYIRPEVMKIMPVIGFTSTALVTTNSKNSIGMSPLQIRRINIDGRCNISDFEGMLTAKLLKACNDETNKTIPR